MKLNNQHSLKKKIKRKKIKKSRKTNLKRKNSILKKLLGGAEQSPDGPYIIKIDFLEQDKKFSGEYKRTVEVDGLDIFKKGNFILFWNKGAWVIVHEDDKDIIKLNDNLSKMSHKGYRFFAIDDDKKYPSKNIGKWEIIKNGEWTDFEIVEPIISYKKKDGTDFYDDSPSTKPFTFEINVTVNKKKQEQFEQIVLKELLNLRTNEELKEKLKKILTKKRIFISFNDIQTGGTTVSQASETAYQKVTAAATAAKQGARSSINSTKRYVSDKKKTVTAIIKIYPTEHLSIDDTKKISEIITNKLNDGTILKQLKKLDIDIVGDKEFKDQFKINSASISNSESKKNPAKKDSYTMDEKKINKELIKLIRKDAIGQNDDIFITGKKSLSIVYKLTDILTSDRIDELIKQYKTSQKKHPDFSKYADDTGVSVVKLFKMPDTNSTHEFTHVLISRNFSSKDKSKEFTTTLKLLIDEIEASATETTPAVVEAVEVGVGVPVTSTPATPAPPAPPAPPAEATKGVVSI